MKNEKIRLSTILGLTFGLIFALAVLGQATPTTASQPVSLATSLAAPAAPRGLFADVDRRLARSGCGQDAPSNAGRTRAGAIESGGGARRQMLPDSLAGTPHSARVAHRGRRPTRPDHDLGDRRGRGPGAEQPGVHAVKYTPEGGRVSVMQHRVDGDAYVQVSDTGIGIPEEATPHLFEEFYRAPNAKVLEKEGTELGLTITRDLIAHYDGRNTVKSQAGQGTTFTVIWPTMRDA